MVEQLLRLPRLVLVQTQPFCFLSFSLFFPFTRVFLFSHSLTMELVLTTGDTPGTSSPFPPNYSAGPLTWTTPLFLTPTALLVGIILFGLGRYLLITRGYPWIDADTPGATRRHLSPLSRLVVAVSITIVLTFLAEAIVFATRAFMEHHWTSTVLAYYIGISWLAWMIGLMCVADETHKFGAWSWVQYMFWILAALGETMVGWLWLVGLLRPRPGMMMMIVIMKGEARNMTGEGYMLNNPQNPFVFVGTVFTVYDYVFFAVFATRYILELGTVLLCIIQMFMIRASEESTPLLANGTNNATNTYGTATTSQQQQQQQHNASKDKSAFSNFFSKMRRLLPYIWPHKSRWLQFLVLVCFSLMLLGLGVNALTPLQIGRVVDGLGEGKGKVRTMIGISSFIHTECIQVHLHGLLYLHMLA